MSVIDKKYHKLLNDILKNGFKYEDPNRKDIYRYQIPHYQLIHNFKDGFPAITTKKLYWKGVVGELLWFLRGSNDIRKLHKDNIHIWDKDWINLVKKKGYSIDTLAHSKNLPDEAYNLGRIYGAQWRNFIGFKGYKNAPLYDIGVDQISNLIKGLKKNPMGTRHIVTAWNPAELNDMALPPCHWSFEILVEPIKLGSRMNLSNKKELEKYIIKSIENSKSAREVREEYLDNNNVPKYQFTLKWHQRSVDTFLGLPFNIASYALLAHIIGKLTNMIPKGIIGDLSNVHIYEPHLDAVKEQLSRDVDKYGECESNWLCEPNQIDDVTNDVIDLMEIKHFELKNYKSYPRIPAEMLSYNK